MMQEIIKLIIYEARSAPNKDLSLELDRVKNHIVLTINTIRADLSRWQKLNVPQEEKDKILEVILLAYIDAKRPENHTNHPGITFEGGH